MEKYKKLWKIAEQTCRTATCNHMILLSSLSPSLPSIYNLSERVLPRQRETPERRRRFQQLVAKTDDLLSCVAVRKKGLFYNYIILFYKSQKRPIYLSAPTEALASNTPEPHIGVPPSLFSLGRPAFGKNRSHIEKYGREFQNSEGRSGREVGFQRAPAACQ